MPRPLDPSGILSRVPELETLASDSGIHKAIERGSPHAIYRALFWARWLGRMRTDAAKQTADTLLANRRLFLQPLGGSAPIMSTVNGIGTTIYGREEQGEDGAYVTTLFLVVLFFPLIPLGAYLVADAGGRSYRFYGKAPLGTFSYLYGMTWLVGAACAALFGMTSALWASSHTTLYVVDGLPVPVVATIGGQTLQVSPESQASIVLGTGTQTITIATLDGRMLESSTIEASAGEDVLAWNVLGAAPLYREDVVYGSSLYQPPTQPDPDLACGQTAVHWGSVDYAFVEPPSSIQMESQYGTEHRSHADVAPGGYRLCAALLASRERFDEATQLLLRVAGTVPPTDSDTLLGLSDAVVRLGGSYEDVVTLLGNARGAAPDDVNLHRAYQDAMIAVGRRDEVCSEYGARRDADPSSADAAYLAQRIQIEADDIASYAALAQQFPDHGLLQRAYGYALYDRHRCSEALDVWARPAALDGGDSIALARAACLVQGGRATEAAALVDEITMRIPQTAEMFAPAYASIAMAGGASDPRLVLSRADFTDAPGARMRTTIESGLPVDRDQFATLDGSDRDITELYWVAAMDPDRALSLAASLTRPAIRQLPQPLFVLLYAEACRLDSQSSTAHSLAAGSPLGPNRTDLLRTFIATGAESGEIDDIYPDVRASAWVVRARATNSPEERALMLQRVAQDDLLGGWATRAMNGWPAPGPTST